MYEIGLAMACRQPVEVLLVRDNIRKSDAERLPFDLFNIPYTSVYPDDLARSQHVIQTAILDRLRTRRLEQDLRFRQVRENLAPGEIEMLLQASFLKNLHNPGVAVGIKQTLVTAPIISGLLDKRIMRVVDIRQGNPPQPFYELTQFGRYVIKELSTLQNQDDLTASPAESSEDSS